MLACMYIATRNCLYSGYIIWFTAIVCHSVDGPYIIACNNDQLFLKVQPDGSVMACNDITESSHFHVKPTGNKAHPYRFYISHSDSSAKTDCKSIKKVARYLEAPVNVRGTNPGPLSVRYNVTQSNCRFTLHSRLVSASSNDVPQGLTSWMDGRDIFFVKCSGPRYHKDGYLCVRQSQCSNYITSCVQDTSAHNDRSIFMLFHLIDAGDIATGKADHEVITTSTGTSDHDIGATGTSSVTDVSIIHKQGFDEDAVMMLGVSDQSTSTSMVPMVEIKAKKV